MQLPVQSWSAALPVHEPGPEASIKTSISKRKTSISVYVFERRYQRIVDIEPPRYRSWNVDIDVSSISGYVDIEIQNVDIDVSSISGYVDIEVYQWQYRYFKLRYRLSYRTRYRCHKSKRRYRNFMVPISAYTDIGYKTSISTSWQGSRCCHCCHQYLWPRPVPCEFRVRLLGS